MTIGCDLVSIKQAVANACSRLSVDAVTFNTYPVMPASPVVPCIVVWSPPDYITYHNTFGSQYLIQINLELRIGTGGRSTDAYTLLDQLLSVGSDQSASIPDLFDASVSGVDNTLGGLVGGITVETGRLIPPGEANSEVFEAAITLKITTNRRTA